jgi:hypothetical protein
MWPQNCHHRRWRICTGALLSDSGHSNAGVPADKRIEFRVGIDQGAIIVEEAISLATGSITPPGWRVWPRRAASASAGSCAPRCATSPI